MLYLHYSTSHDYGFNHYAHEFNINARVQKTFLDGNLTAVLFANDIFRNLRERWTGYYPVTTMAKDAYVYTQSIGLSLSYNFNTTRSKYKGTGAGNAEKKWQKVYDEGVADAGMVQYTFHPQSANNGTVDIFTSDWAAGDLPFIVSTQLLMLGIYIFLSYLMAPQLPSPWIATSAASPARR